MGEPQICQSFPRDPSNGTSNLLVLGSSQIPEGLLLSIVAVKAHRYEIVKPSEARLTATVRPTVQGASTAFCVGILGFSPHLKKTQFLSEQVFSGIQGRLLSNREESPYSTQARGRVVDAQGLELEETMEKEGRMDLESEDYPGTGANNRHDPRSPGADFRN
ncbi:Transmembrane channel-like protein [Senna tora]|uniref:Transmembrane channel-like protein n=1 Tax=Senna tora TaxID=362788 RepID=A0A834TDY7_9FABA|nr:Transmembrane channel-like protein [Senna tora]